jgi:hypothetical protein
VEKAAIIVTDGTESTRKTAEDIVAELKDYKVVSVDAKDLSGVDLLASSIYFFGAEKSDPPSFSYLYKMLQHINLVGRPCGIFSGSKDACEYLRKMVHDSELALYSEPFLGEGDIIEWVKKVIV